MENSISDITRGPIRFLIFSASLRADSFNTKLVKLAATIIEKQNGQLTLRT
jgi:NAD(P)H-dependent FMN reductase